MNDVNHHRPEEGKQRGLWRRMKAHVLHPELSSAQVALSFALGFSICWNPFIGTHTWLVLGLCFAFKRLHRPLVFAAAFLNNPWTLVPIATASTYSGNFLLGHGWRMNLQGVQWSSMKLSSFLSRAGFEAMVSALRPVLKPYLLGGCVLSALAFPVGYCIMLYVARRLRRPSDCA